MSHSFTYLELQLLSWIFSKVQYQQTIANVLIKRHIFEIVKSDNNMFQTNTSQTSKAQVYKMTWFVLPPGRRDIHSVVPSTGFYLLTRSYTCLNREASS